MKTTTLKLSQIVTTAGTQVRAKIDDDTVDQYAKEWSDGAVFPPVCVFHDGNQYILADGFHRVMAASRNGYKDIQAEIHKGTKADALKFALAANAKHGLKRSNADKRRAVELALGEWPSLSDRELAKICAVCDTFVGDTRKSNCGLTAVENEKRKGADGKERKMPTRKAKKSIEEIAGDLAPNIPPPTRDHSAAYTSAPAKTEREFSKEEKAALEALELCCENIKFVTEQIMAGTYDPSEASDVRLQFQVTAKILANLPKQS